MKRPKKRTESFGISFVDELAEGWAFGVHESFRDQLDIQYRQFVDKERTKEIRNTCPKGEDGRPPTIFRMAWSRGVPPLLKFATGDLFYDPPAVRHMAWQDAVKVLQRTAQVVNAQPDDAPGTGGWVRFRLRRYEGGTANAEEEYMLSQAGFEGFLRTGQLPPDVNACEASPQKRLKAVVTQARDERLPTTCQNGALVHTGMEEADRQLRVACRLYEATRPKVPWAKPKPQKRRSYIDRSCQAPYVDCNE